MQPRSIRSAGVGLLIAAMAMSGSSVGATGASLVEAIRQNDVAAAKRLIAQGADVKAADAAGATQLMYAAFYGGLELLRARLDRGATINTANTFGATALMWAASQALVRRFRRFSGEVVSAPAASSSRITSAIVDADPVPGR